MRRKNWVNITAASLVLAAAFSLISLPKAQAFDNANWGANYFPNVVLTTQDGKQVKFYDDLLRNKMFAINLIYTHCTDICPLETAKLGQVYKLLQDRMGKDLYFYSITIDPKRDTPAVLKAYSEKFHTGPGWYFLTGKKEDIDAIRKKLGIALRPNSDPLTGHTTSLMIGNEAAGQWILDSSMDDPITWPRFWATGCHPGNTTRLKPLTIKSRPWTLWSTKEAARCFEHHALPATQWVVAI